jgi:hypothetical protein
MLINKKIIFYLLYLNKFMLIFESDKNCNPKSLPIHRDNPKLSLINLQSSTLSQKS